MYITRKKARKWLQTCSRSELNSAMDEARLTELQREIVELAFSRGLSVVAIKLQCSMDESTVKRILARAYDKIYNVIR